MKTRSPLTSRLFNPYGPLMRFTALLMMFVFVASTSVQSATLYWNGANVSASPAAGGTGTWNTTNAWRSVSATGSQATWAAAAGGTDNAILAGTAGTITLGTSGATNFTGADMTVNTTGYIITSGSSSRNLVFTGTLSLANNVGLTLDLNNSGGTWGFGTISFGTGSSLTLQGAATKSNANRLNLSTTGTISGGSITLAGTGAGVTGFVSSVSAASGGVTLNTDILNNSSTSATMLGAGSPNLLTYGGVLSGSANLQIASGQSGGAGIVVLNNNNLYTGGTYLNSANNGVTRIGVSNALPSGTTVFFGQSAGGGTADTGGSIDLNGKDLAIAALDGGADTRGVANNTSTLSTLTIGKTSGSNTFSGNIGTVTNSNLTTQSTNIKLIKTGGSEQIFNSTNTYTGGTDVQAGKLTLGHATNTLADTGAVTVSGGELALGTNTDTVGAVTMSSGSITGSGTSLQGVLTGTSYALTGTGSISAKLAGNGVTLTKSNAGTATLSATNTYTGTTTISGGTLALGSAGSISSSAIIDVQSGKFFDVSAVSGGYQLASGQTLKGNGTVTGGMTVLSGATLSPGASPGMLNLGNTTLNGGGNYNWQLFDTSLAAGTGWDLMNVTGTLNIAATSGNKFNLNLWTLSSIFPSDVNGSALKFNSATNYSWQIATASGGITGFTLNDTTLNSLFTINTAAANNAAGFANALGGGTFSLALANSNKDINLIFTAASTNLFWSAGTWGTTPSGSGGNGNWADSAGSWDPSKTANFAGTAGAVTATTVTANNGITFSTTGYTVSGGTITLSSTGANNVITTDTNVSATVTSALSTTAGITKSGSGTLVLTTSQTYTGGTTVSSGILQLGDGATNNGSVAGNITDNATVAFANPNAQSFGGIISGSGAVTKSGAGKLTLTNTNSYTGGTTITAGTLALGHATDTLKDTGAVTINGGTLDIGANTDTVGTVTLSSGSITGTVDGRLTASSYVVNNTSGTATITANLSGGGGLAKSGAGSLSLSGNNDYTGGTALNGGVVSVASDINLGNASGALSFDGGALTLTGNLVTNRALTVNSNGGTFNTGGNTFSTDNTITINGTLATTGSGNLAFTGSGTTLTFGAAGALNIGTGGSATIAGSYSTINMANGGVFTGDLIINSTARFNLNGSGKTYGGAGNIYLLGSSLGVGNGGSSGTAFSNFNALISNLSSTPGGTVTSNIVLNPANSGNVTGHVTYTPGVITGTNYTNASYLAFIGGTTTGQGITIGDSSHTNGIISGEGDLYIGNNSKTGGGAGNVTLNAANTYLGNTLINASGGNLILGTANALPTTTNVIFGSLSGAGSSTLDLNGNNQQIASLSDDAAKSASKILTITNKGAADVTLKISGSVTPGNGFGGVISDGNTNKIALTKDGSNTLALSNTNTYTGATAVNGGILLVNGSLAAGSAVTVGASGTLAGAGNGTSTGLVSGTVSLSGTITPGTSANTVGKLTTGALTLNGGAAYNWDILNATGTAGTDWSQIIVPSLNISGLTNLTPGTTTFAINLFTLASSGNAGALFSFNPNSTQSWSILTSAATISGFNSNLFTINSSGFGNSISGGSFSLGLGNANKDLVLNFTPGSVDLTWNNHANTSQWNTTDANFTNGSINTAFVSNNNVTFDNTTTPGSVTVAGGGVTPGNTIVSNTSGTYAFTGGSINGGGSLTKSNAGTLDLTGQSSGNGYSGGTAINGGSVIISADNQLGSGNITLGGGTLQTNGAFTSTKTLATTTSTSSIFNNNGNDVTYGALTDNGNISFTGSGTTTVGAISGSAGTLTVGGNGNLITTGLYNNAGTLGSLTVSSGSNFTIDAASGTSKVTSGTIDGSLVLTNGVRLDFNTGTTGGSGNVQVQSTGTVISNTSGVAGGTLNSALQLNSTGSAFTKGDVTATIYAPGTFVTSIGGTKLTNSGDNTLTLGGIISGNSDVNISNSATGGGGSGHLLLNAANTYTGVTTINTNGGNLLLGVDNALPVGTDVIFGTLSGVGSPALDLNGHNQQIASLSHGPSGTSPNFKITNNGTTDVNLTISGSTTPANPFGGVISDGTTNKITLVKNGSNTLSLSGNNTYTGGTTINGGTLKIGGGGNILADTGAVTLGGGTLDINGHNEGVGAVTLNSGSIVNSDAANQNKSLTVASVTAQSGTISANIAGTGGITKVGLGDLVLGGSNTYTGATNINGGTLKISDLQNLGDSSQSSNTVGIAGGATLESTGNTYALGANRAITLGTGGGIIKTSAGALTVDGAVNNAGNLLTVSGAGDTTISGAISGNGGLTKSGVGTLSLTGSNTYTGTTTASAGTLSLNHTAPGNAIAGDLNINGGTVKLLQNEQIANTAAITQTSGTFDLNGRTETINSYTNNGGTFLTGGGTLIGLGNTLTWSGGTNTVSNGGNVQDAHIVISDGINTVEGGAAGGVLQLNASGTGLEMSNGATLTLNSDATVAGKLLLKGNVSTTGNSTVTIANSGSATNKGNIDLDGGTRTFTVADGTATSDLTISAVITNGALTKAGAGNLALSNTNTYTGATTVNEGTLQVGVLGAGSIASSAVTVTSTASNVLSGAPVIAGTGTITGNLTIGTDSTHVGVIRPGDLAGNSNGTLTIGGNLIVKDGSQLQLGLTSTTQNDADFNWFVPTGGHNALNYLTSFVSPTNYSNFWDSADGGYDSISVTGTLTLGTGGANYPTLLASTNGSFSYQKGDIFKLLNYSGIAYEQASSFAGGSAFSLPTDLVLPTLGAGYSWDTSALNGFGVVVVIPEPGRMMLMFFGLAALFMRRRRNDRA